MMAAGHTTTISDPVPVDITGFDQVWDIRFLSNFEATDNLAITAPQQAQYLAYLHGGGGMFVTGENQAFATRNNSVLSLIAAAGGGSLAFINLGNQLQNVNDPFTGPNAVATVTYASAGGVTSPGTGQFITQLANGSAGTGVAFGVGDLANAPLGTLAAIFDVNFMQGNVNLPNSQDLTKNLIQFIEGEVTPPPPNGAVPEPTTLTLLEVGLIGLGVFGRRRG